MKEVFEDGTVIFTGKDMIAAMESMYNHRDNYDRDCGFCTHEGDEEFCEDCSLIEGMQHGCSCHINPPCGFCVGLKFEPTEFLINYQHCKSAGRRRWECFKGDTFSVGKLSEIEDAGFNLCAETLTTGEVSITVEDSDQDYEIEICNKPEFKKTVIDLITRFDIKEALQTRRDLDGI